MKKNIFLLLFITISGILNPLIGQDFFRIKADFSIKEKTPEGTSKLTMGTVFFDKNINKLVYDIQFPEPTTIIMMDTLLMVIDADQNVKRTHSGNSNMFSVFNLALNGALEHYGLKNSPFKITDIEKTEQMVITTWTPPENMAKYFGKTVVSQKDKTLFGVVFFDPEDHVKGKQFFKKYTTVDGVAFPTEVIQITPDLAKDYYKVTTYKNVKINEMSDETMYDFDVDAYNE